MEISRLKNGLTVATDPMPQIETAAVGVWVSAGGRYETPEVLGVSHFLEHMAFKGTETRSAVEIAETMESVGGYLSAWTSREQTAYYSRCLKEDVPRAIEVLGDILIHSVYDKAELERERGVILQEIGQCADNPEDYIYDMLQEAAFPDQPLGRPILGTTETVRAMTAEKLRNQMADWYATPRMFVVGAGNIDHTSLVTLCEEHFGALPASGRGTDCTPGSYTGGIALEPRDFEQTHITLSVPGVSAEDDDHYVAQVYSEILGGGMSSRLFQEAREKRGLCYSIYSFHSGYLDTGLFSVYAGTAPDDASVLLDVVTDEMEKMTKGVTEQELSRALAQVRASVLMSLENAYSRAEWAARHLARYGRVLTRHELVANFERVDNRRLTDFASRLMKTKNPTIAALGPVGGLDSCDRIKARFGT